MANNQWYIGMAEDAIRQRFVDTALAYLGVREGTAEHKEIVNLYFVYQQYTVAGCKRRGFLY